MSSATYDSFKDSVSTEELRIASLFQAVSMMPSFFLGTIKIVWLHYSTLSHIDKMLTGIESFEGVSEEAPTIDDLVYTLDHFKKLISSISRLIGVQKEHKIFRYFIGWELVVIDRLEDIVEDLEISTDPEITSLMEEAGEKLSPADVI